MSSAVDALAALATYLRGRGSARDLTPFRRRPLAERQAATRDQAERTAADPRGRGVFSSVDVLPGDESWEPGRLAHEVDVDFITVRPEQDLYYYASIQTVAHAWARAFISQGHRAVARQISEADRIRQREHDTRRGRLEGNAWVLDTDWQPLGLASLGGRTERDAFEDWLRTHWAERGRIRMRQRMDLDRCYPHGVRLHLTVAEPHLDIEALVRSVQAFHARGERAYRGPREPFERHQAAVDALLCPVRSA